jgi:hypothetical protein
VRECFLIIATKFFSPKQVLCFHLILFVAGAAKSLRLSGRGLHPACSTRSLSPFKVNGERTRTAQCPSVGKRIGRTRRASGCFTNRFRILHSHCSKPLFGHIGILRTLRKPSTWVNDVVARVDVSFCQQQL